MKRMRIAAITGNRSDYDLMSYLYRLLNRDADVDFGLIVTGAHLLPEYRDSLREMERDGNRVIASIADLTGGDELKDRAVGMGRLIEPLANGLEEFTPDVLIGVGDREEAPAAALAAAYMKIPFVHFFGGDFVPDGHPDNLARAATSKLATVHMVALEEHRRRLLAMGEPDFRIHVIGSIALDKFREEPFAEKRDILDELGLTDWDEYAIVIYHPPTEIEGENFEIRNILKALKDRGLRALVSYPNTDAGSSHVTAEFAAYEGDSNFYFYRNFGRNAFVNLFRHARLQIGNSSAGICESASVRLPVVNVGSRNRKRSAQENVIFAGGTYEEITAAIDEALSDGFATRSRTLENQYGDGRSSQRAYELIKGIDYNTILLKREDPLKGRNDE
jgi:GDP/UDP-N,N'-diacetylbacillosamine 2-epimerase (hydrolysing)